MHAKQSKGTCNRPVNQWRLLQELKPVQPRRDPIAAGKHAARDLRLDGIDIVHQRRWRNNAAQKNNGGNRDHDQQSVPKDHRTLLAALAALRAQPWELDLVGAGPLEMEMRDLASELGLGGRVRFLGYVADPAPVLAGAQLFVLSSRSEAFPRSVLEALRAGLPVVASAVGGIGEAVTDGVNGLLVP